LLAVNATIQKSNRRIVAAIVALCAVIFYCDLLLPVGVGPSLLYVAAILISLWLRDRKYMIVVSAAVTALTVCGFFLKPPGMPWMGAVNRTFSILMFWVAAALGIAAKKAIEALLDQESLTRAVLESAVDGVIVIDERGVIESANPAALRTFGYTAEELVGRNVRLLMPAPFREEHDDYLKRYRETGEKRIIGAGRSVSGLRKDGSTFPLDLSVSEFHVRGRRMFTGIVRDISARRLMEEQLVRSERLAAIGQMVAGIAHESRNALQRIHANVEMLELDFEDPQKLETLARISKAADDVHHLLEEVRNFAGPLTLERQPCSVASVWRQAWALLAPMHNRRTIDFREAIEADDAQCLIDPFRMQQVFRNLFENSLAACSDPARIEVHCSTIDEEGIERIRVAVRDSGPGLSAEQREKVFDAFYSTKSKGTGLGMAIVKRIIEAHHGTVDVGASEQGAEFVITLPRREYERRADRSRPPSWDDSGVAEHISGPKEA
jgi:PAS domain S-box-containing protein